VRKAQVARRGEKAKGGKSGGERAEQVPECAARVQEPHGMRVMQCAAEPNRQVEVNVPPDIIRDMGRSAAAW